MLIVTWRFIFLSLEMEGSSPTTCFKVKVLNNFIVTIPHILKDIKILQRHKITTELHLQLL